MGYFLVVGLGQTGFSCVAFLQKRGVPVRVVDSRESPPLAEAFRQAFPHVGYRFGTFQETDFIQAETILLSPGVARTTPAILAARARKIPIMNDIDLFCQARDATIAAITGTNGKTTVATLLGAMLRRQGHPVIVAGNIGVPVLNAMDERHSHAVLELSSFQLETTTQLKADVACCLNISPDHLDRYPSYSAYVAAKRRIYQGAQFCVYNRDEPATEPDGQGGQAGFSLVQPTDAPWGVQPVAEDYVLTHLGQPLLSVSELKIKGQPNWQNALAASAMAHHLQVEKAVIQATLKQFPGLPHRCQWVRELNHVAWYNDSKGTNVGATLAALHGLGATCVGKIILLAGGQAKGGDFTPLNPVLAQYARTLIVFGEDGERIQAAVTSVATHAASSLADAVKHAHDTATPGDIVLLSPACASFDAFQSYAERGDVFMNLVQELR